MNISFISIFGGSWNVSNANLIVQNCFFGRRNRNDMMRTEQVTNKSMFLNNTASDSVWSNSKEVISDFSLNLAKATGVFLNTTFRNINIKNSNTSVIEASLQSQLHFSFSNISEIYGIDLNSHFVQITNNTLLKIQYSTMERNNIFSLIESFNNSNLIIEDSIFIKNKGVRQCIGVFNGTVHINRSSFTENEITAVNGEFSCNFFISNSTFAGNHYAGMLISLFYKGALEIETSIFKNNVNTDMYPCIYVNFEVPVKLRDSTFFNNTGLYTGSIFISNSRAVINNVSFSNNSGAQASCIYAPKNAVVNVIGCKFNSNTEGSVVYATPGSELNIADSIFTDHVLPEGSLIEIENTHLDLINCTVTNNTMGKIGIVQASTYCQITVRNCMFDQNAGKYGAVFYLSIKSSLFISDSQFHNNVASVGGCVYLLDSILDITESMFSNNSAYVYAGAIAAERSNITMKLSHFYYHKSGVRGGILDMTNSTLVAQNCSMENNSAQEIGAAIYKNLNGQIILDGCWLNMNRAPQGVIWYYHYIDSIFRLSHTSCFTCGNCGPCIEFIGKDGYNFTMYTLNFSISKRGISLSSTELNFASEAIEYGVIVSEERKKIYLTETAFASGIKS